MKYVKMIFSYLKERFAEREITSYIGILVVILYLFGVITGEQYATLHALVENMGWGMPAIGAALVAAPESKIKAKK